MDTEELKNIWQAYDAKLEKSLKLNLRFMEEIQSQKAKSKLRSILIWRIIEFVFLILFLFFLGGFLFKHFFEIQFSIPAAILMVLYIIVFSNCIRQIVIIKQIDYSENVADIQKKLTVLQSHIADYVRLSFLFFPTFLAYPVILVKAFTSFDITKHFDHDWWVGNIIFSIAIIPLCIWLYQKVSYKNMHKKWVRKIIESMASNQVSKAMDFTFEIDEFKKGIS